MSTPTHGPRSAKWPLAHMARETWSKFYNKRIPRIDPPERWVSPKNRIRIWKILEGDKVKIIRGNDRGKVGTVKSVDKWTNRVVVEGLNLGWRTPKELTMDSATKPKLNGNERGGHWMRPYERPMHVTNVQLIHPDDWSDDITLKNKRVISVQWRKIDVRGYGPAKDRYRWRRYVSNEKKFGIVQIPFPKVTKEHDPEETQEETEWDTPAKVVRAFTFAPTYVDPLPGGVIDELRNKYKWWRYKHRHFI